MSKFKDATVAKPNSHLLEKLEDNFEKLEKAKENYKALKEFYEENTPEERKAIIAKRESKKTGNSNLTAKEKKEKDIEENIGKDDSWLGMAKTFVLGKDPEPYVEKITEIVEVASETFKGATPGIMKMSDPCENHELILAERTLIARKYEARQLLKQVKKRLNPFVDTGLKIDLYDPSNLGLRPRIQSRSAQEAMQLLTTVYVYTKKIADKTGDTDLKRDAENLFSIINVGSKLNQEDFASIGLSSEVLSDEQVAKKWGLDSIDGPHSLSGLVKNSLPQMYFEVQQMVSAYNVLQTVKGVREASEILVKEIDLNDNLTDKNAEKKRVLEKLINEKITGEQGIQKYTRRYVDGAAISTPIEFNKHGELTLEQGTVLRLLIAKTKFEVGNELEEEAAYRLEDNYNNFVDEGRINDEILELKEKKAEDLSEQEVDEMLSDYRQKDSFGEMRILLDEIKSQLPAFIELRKTVENFSSDMSYDQLVSELDKSESEIMKVIEQTLNLTPEKSVALADAFVSSNEGNLSDEAKQVPGRVRQFLGRVYEH